MPAPAPPPVVLDVRGRPCPVPVIEAAKALAVLAPGALLELRGTDPAIPDDLRAFCAATGHQLLALAQEGSEVVATLRRGGHPST